MLNKERIVISPKRIYGYGLYRYETERLEYINPEISYDEIYEFIKEMNGDLSNTTIEIEGYSSWEIQDLNRTLKELGKDTIPEDRFDFFSIIGNVRIKELGTLNLYSGRYEGLEALNGCDIGSMRFKNFDGSGSFELNIESETYIYPKNFHCLYHTVRFTGNGKLIIDGVVDNMEIYMFTPSNEGNKEELFGINYAEHLDFGQFAYCNNLKINMPFYIYNKISEYSKNYIYNSKNVFLLGYVNDKYNSKEALLDILNKIHSANVTINASIDIHSTRTDIFEYLNNFITIKNKTILIDFEYSSQDFNYKRGSSYGAKGNINNYKILQKINNNNLYIHFKFDRNAYGSGAYFRIKELSLDIFNNCNIYVDKDGREQYFIGGKNEEIAIALDNLIGTSTNKAKENNSVKKAFIKKIVDTLKKGEGLYAKCTEYNEWEGEDWNFYILIDNAYLKLVQHFYSVMEDEDLEYYEAFDFNNGKFLTLDQVNTIVDNSDSGYMAYENGPFKISSNKIKSFLDCESLEDCENILYKGGIKDISE